MYHKQKNAIKKQKKPIQVHSRTYCALELSDGCRRRFPQNAIETVRLYPIINTEIYCV